MTSRRRVLPQRSALNEACGPVTRLKARRTEAKKEPAFGKKKRTPRIEKEEWCSDACLKGSEFEVSSPTYALDFMSQLHQFYQDGICCDVVLSTGDYQTTAHKVVLMASSEYFKSFFQAQGSSCDFIFMPPGISSGSLQTMITFLYTGALCLNFDNVFSLHSTAEQLQIKTAVELCKRFCNDTGIQLPNASSQNVDSAFDKIAEIEIKTEVSTEELSDIRDCWPFSGESINNISAAPSHAAAVCIEATELHSLPKKRRGRPPKAKQECFEKELMSLPQEPQFERKARLSKNAQRKQSDSRPRDHMHELLAPGGAHQCESCESKFRWHFGLLIHRKWRHGVVLPSMGVSIARRLICWSAFMKFYRSYLVSNDSSGRLVYSCPHCRRNFARASWCLAHIVKHHFSHLHHYRPSKIRLSSTTPKFSASRLPYKCSSCWRVFRHLSNLRIHCVKNHPSKVDKYYREIYKRERRRAREWDCREFNCGLRFSSGENLKRHMAIAHSLVTYSCPDCKFTSQLEKLFLRHREQRHGQMKICHICGKGCYKAYQLKQHLYSHHKVKDPSLKLFRCPREDCGYECISRNRLEDHSKRHTLTKLLKCDACGKAFKHDIGLERHMKAIHQGIRPFICDQCGLAFGLEHELKTHVNRHSDHKPHACDLCPFRSFNKSNLKLHLYSQHNIETNFKISIHKCDQCPFKSHSRGRYEDHLKKHRNVKDVQCPECGKMFFSKKNLYGHAMKVHRPKNLCCSYCNFSTAIRSKYKCHMRTKHQRLVDGTEISLSETLE